MTTTRLMLILGALLTTVTATAQEPTALSCSDFRPTAEAIERFPNLVGACEAIVERDGELFGLFRADVRRVRGPMPRTEFLPAVRRCVRATCRPDRKSVFISP